MMLTKGMTIEQVEGMVKTAGWEIFDDEEYKAFDGSMALSMTVLQGDHAVAVDFFHGVIDELQYIPAWAL